jgi:putative transposase
MRPGKPEGRIPDYFRDGIASLFAALYIGTGDVLGKRYRRHRAKEFLSLRKEIETHVTREVEECKEIHLEHFK